MPFIAKEDPKQKDKNWATAIVSSCGVSSNATYAHATVFSKKEHFCIKTNFITDIYF